MLAVLPKIANDYKLKLIRQKLYTVIRSVDSEKVTLSSFPRFEYLWSCNIFSRLSLYIRERKR